jgi:preprotein translocase subunit SecD
MQQSVEIVRRRVDEAGTREPTIQRQGADRILIQVPGIGSAQELKDLIGTTARLTFQPVVGRADSAEPKASSRASRSARRWTRRGCSTSSSRRRWSRATT